jgi:hypothetical protein
MNKLKLKIAGLFILFAAIMFIIFSFLNRPNSTGQWDIFEKTIHNTKKYNNPFTDVTLTVSYTRPDSSIIQFWGFYAGNTTWKIRFMPDQLGMWQYKASFSDASVNINGKFNCVKSNIPGLISKDEINPIWMGYKGGHHELVRSFHTGDKFFASNWPDSARQEFLDWCQHQSYNMLSIASHYLNRDKKSRGKNYKTPHLWDDTSNTPNPNEYDQMEVILNELKLRKLLVFPFAGFFGANSNYPKTPEYQTLYIKYTLARIAPYWNIILNVAGPELAKWTLTEEDVNRLGTEVKNNNIFNHLLGCHQTSNKNLFQNQSWISIDIIQGLKTTDLDKLYSGLTDFRSFNCPVYAHEVLWGGNKNHPFYTFDQLRKNANVIMMTASVLNFADNNGNSSSGFSGSLDLNDKNQIWHEIIKQVWDFFETIPFYKMNPRQNLVNNGYCLAEDGKQYLVYLPYGGTVDVSLIKGTYIVQWINAQNHNDKRKNEMTINDRGFESPNTGDDWFLYLVKYNQEL